MIQNDEELKTTLERIARFQRWLMDMRRTTDPDDFTAMSSGYRLEIEKMQAEVLEYLLYPTIMASMNALTQNAQAPVGQAVATS